MEQATGSTRSMRSSERTTSETQSGVGSSLYVNYVVEAASIHPSIASCFSLDRTDSCNLSPMPPRTLAETLQPTDLLDTGQVSTSYQEHLEQVDMLDDPSYTDTVKSTDSTGSLLRRSMSVPPQYTYQAPERKHVKEIFSELFSQPGKQVKQAAADVQKPGDKGKWRQTMADLVENPDYQNSLESTSSQTGLLARMAVSIAQAGRGVKTGIIPEEVDEVAIDAGTGKEHKRYTKNLMVLSVSFMLTFTAYLALRNLQSSLYPSGGLGLYGLSAVYATILVGCLFATTIVQRLRPKRVMVLCMVGILVQVIANYYPSYYTLLPASSLVGFCMANLWTAHATYLTSIALQYSNITGKSMAFVISKFNGIFFMFFQLANVLGGIISSTILMLQASTLENKNSSFTEENSTENVTIATASPHVADYSHCGANYCSGSGEETSGVNDGIVYLLLSIFVAFAVGGLVVIMVFLDQLEGIIKRSHSSMGKQMLSLFRLFGDLRVVCISGFMFYSLMQVSFMFGEYTTAFVTCALGMEMVGYVMLCVSACSACSAFFNNKIQKHVGNSPLMFTAGLIQLSLLLVMLLWEPSHEHVAVFFLLAAAWGVADGILMTQLVSVIGFLFSDKKEPAFAAMKMSQALGVTVLFSTSPYLCMRVKIILMMAMVVIAMIGLVLLEVMTRCKVKKDKRRQENAPGTPV